MDFESYKAHGPDEVHPIMIKCVSSVIAPGLCDIIRYCLSTGLTPENWLETKVIFIPKPGKRDYKTPESFRPICLMSFLLKLIEKVVVHLLKEKIDNLHAMQFAYRKTRSTVEALNKFSHTVSRRLVRKVRNKTKANKTTYASIVDISGAFDKPKLTRLEEAMKKHEIKDYIINWTINMNSNRFVEAKLCEESKKVKPLQGFAQGGNLSCYLWLFYVDELISKLNNIKNLTVFAYSDDFVLVLTAFFDRCCQKALQAGLNLMQEWCQTHELDINPEKCTHIRFSRRRNLPTCNVKFFGNALTFAKKSNILGGFLMINSLLGNMLNM